MSARLRRWLLEPQSPADDAVGGLLAGVVVLLLFRFAFDDSWPFAIGAAIAVAVASTLYSAWRRRRRVRGR